MWPGSIPGFGVKCGLSLLLVLVLAPRGFCPGSPVFPSPQKPTFPNSNSIWNSRATGLSVVLSSVTLVKCSLFVYFYFVYLFIYLFICLLLFIYLSCGVVAAPVVVA